MIGHFAGQAILVANVTRNRIDDTETKRPENEFNTLRRTLKTVFRAFSLMSERGESNPNVSSRNPLPTNSLENGPVDESVNSQCLDGSTCQLMAEADSDLFRLAGLWDQLPSHLRNTIMMLINACESKENPENE